MSFKVKYSSFVRVQILEICCKNDGVSGCRLVLINLEYKNWVQQSEDRVNGLVVMVYRSEVRI